LGDLVRKSSLVSYGAALLTAVGLLAAPATMSAASAAVHPRIVPCTLTAYEPSTSSGDVQGYATFSCSANDDLQIEVCLQQLITGGWVDVVGGCYTSPVYDTNYLWAQSKAYPPTCGRYYRTWAEGWNDGVSGSTVSDGYEGCS
jgi:hypothetical protein